MLSRGFGCFRGLAALERSLHISVICSRFCGGNAGFVCAACDNAAVLRRFVFVSLVFGCYAASLWAQIGPRFSCDFLRQIILVVPLTIRPVLHCKRKTSNIVIALAHNLFMVSFYFSCTCMYTLRGPSQIGRRT